MACKQPKVLINAVDHFKFAKSEWNVEKKFSQMRESLKYTSDEGAGRH